jgi:AcrR family transcriptional regulator
MGRRKKFDREDVLSKTIPVFWKHGLAETTVKDLEKATHVNKSGLYAEFQNKEDLFIESLGRYFEELQQSGTLTTKPLGWVNIEKFLKVAHGNWGQWRQKGCFSVNSMREFADLPPKARALMVGSLILLKKQLIKNLSETDQRRGDNDSLADLILTFFCGVCVLQNLDPPLYGAHSCNLANGLLPLRRLSLRVLSKGPSAANRSKRSLSRPS